MARPFLPPALAAQHGRAWARWARRVTNVCGLACIFTCWSLLLQSDGDADPVTTAVRSGVLAFVGGGTGAFSLLLGSPRAGRILLLLGAASFVTSMVRLHVAG